jgi:hypothetical protein
LASRKTRAKKLVPISVARWSSAFSKKIPVARLLLRTARVTGKTWMRSLEEEEADLWMPIYEFPDEPTEE